MTEVSSDSNVVSKSPWTLVALKEYMDRRFEDNSTAVTAALQAAEKAVTKAEIATDKRFEALTEDADRRQKELTAQIAVLQANMNARTGSENTSRRVWGLLLPTVLSITSIIVLIYVSIYR